MHKQRAQVLVEFAIVTLVLIPLVLGILGAGRAFYWYVDMSGLARYGALYATSLSSATACSAAQTQVQSQVRNNFIANHPGQSAPTVTLTCPFPTVSPLEKSGGRVSPGLANPAPGRSSGWFPPLANTNAARELLGDGPWLREFCSGQVE